jgi:hypothetical protein
MGLTGEVNLLSKELFAFQKFKPEAGVFLKVDFSDLYSK